MGLRPHKNAMNMAGIITFIYIKGGFGGCKGGSQSARGLARGLRALQGGLAKRTEGSQSAQSARKGSL